MAGGGSTAYTSGFTTAFWMFVAVILIDHGGRKNGGCRLRGKCTFTGLWSICYLGGWAKMQTNDSYAHLTLELLLFSVITPSLLPSFPHPQARSLFSFPSSFCSISPCIFSFFSSTFCFTSIVHYVPSPPQLKKKITLLCTYTTNLTLPITPSYASQARSHSPTLFHSLPYDKSEVEQCV